MQKENRVHEENRPIIAPKMDSGLESDDTQTPDIICKANEHHLAMRAMNRMSFLVSTR